MAFAPDRPWHQAALLAAFVLVALGVSLFGGFVWDDGPLIVDNPLIKDSDRLGGVLTSSFWETGDRHDRFRTFFRPVVILSYALDHAVWGLRPFGFHLTNLLLHFACCWLVLRIARQDGAGSWAALAGAALFAVHPVHVESVAWICGRTDVTATLCVLGAFYLERRAAAKGGGFRRRLPGLLLFAAGLFAKEMAATLPLLILADRWLDGGPSKGRSVRALNSALPFFGTLGVYLVLRGMALGQAGEPLFTLGPVAFGATTVFVLARYATLLLLPLRLDAHYPYQPFENPLAPAVLVGLAMLALIAVAGYRFTRTRPRGRFWLLWVGVALAPVLAFGRFGDVLLADRFLYLPSVGLALLAARALTTWLDSESRYRRPALAAVMLVLLALAGASHTRSLVWKNDLRLFTDMLRTSPDSGLVHNNFGLALYHRGELARAVEEFQAAVELTPGYSLAHNNLAAALERSGDEAGALTQYETALRLAPGLLEAEVNRGSLLVRTGRPLEGLTTLQRLAQQHPSSTAALYALADALDRTGRSVDALPLLARIRAAEPAHAESHYLTGKILLHQGRLGEAADSMRRFLDLWPLETRHTLAARDIIARDEAESARNETRR